MHINEKSINAKPYNVIFYDSKFEIYVAYDMTMVGAKAESKLQTGSGASARRGAASLTRTSRSDKTGGRVARTQP